MAGGFATSETPPRPLRRLAKRGAERGEIVQNYQ